MARSQGLNRLTNGITRQVHKSEAERGYIFITKDQAFLSRCDYNVDVHLNGKSLGIKTIDKFGRIFPKGEWRQKLKSSKSISLKAEEGLQDLDIKLS